MIKTKSGINPIQSKKLLKTIKKELFDNEKYKKLDIRVSYDTENFVVKTINCNEELNKEIEKVLDSIITWK